MPENHPLREEPAPIGVGFLGGGPVTQAIHLPSLARLTDLFTVTHVMDVDATVAQMVAARVGAAYSSSIDELLADPNVEVVAICSPHRFHAAQVIAACRAGKKAVLCEKPFAVSAGEAEEIAAVSAETGVPIVVGAMHTFDPGWTAAGRLWGDLPQSAHTIRSSIVLPPNSRFEDFATEVIARPDGGWPTYETPKQIADTLEGGVLGLAIHDLPLIRRFVPTFDDLRVLHAEVVRPWGYLLQLRAGGRTIELVGVMSTTWRPDWTLRVIGRGTSLGLTFTPSYVHGGSATLELATADGSHSAGPFGHNGYEGEWRRIAEVVRGTAEAPEAETLIEDLRFALAIVAAVRSHVMEAAA